MLIGVVGLGLIGGSFAKAYSRAGHDVVAADTDNSVLQFAILSGVVKQELTEELIPQCDLILLCTYPNAVIEYMEKNAKLFGSKPVVIDSCGIKRYVVDRGMEIARENGFTFVGGHPMAGTHNSGFKYSRENMFSNAPMVIVPPDFDNIELLDKVKALLAPCGFARISVTTAEKHDKIIAYTSQLAHIVSSAYIKSPSSREHKGISAGSYKDMTRVAQLNPEMWTELFMDNRYNLINEINTLIDNLSEYRDAIRDKDAEKITQLLDEGRKIKKEVDR